MLSTRLKGKVLLPLLDEPLLIRMIERVSSTKKVGRIVVATTTDKEDDAIAELCASRGIDFYRGNPTDLLDRHFQVGIKYYADAIVKIPSDCPLIDPRIIDKVIRYYEACYRKFDFVSNLHPATFPDGNDVEVMSMEALERSWLEAFKNYQREHTTPYMWENPSKFKIGNVEWETGLDYSLSHRFTIDYYEDYLFIKRVFEELYPVSKIFRLEEILRLLDNKPEISSINKQFCGSYWYDNHISEIKNIEDYLRKKHVSQYEKRRNNIVA